MKLATFFLLCMAWIKCTVSPNVSSEDAATTVAMAANLVRTSRIFESSARYGSPVEIRHDDYIVVYKVKNGQFKGNDVARGRLAQLTRPNLSPQLGSLHVVAQNLHSQIEATYGNPGSVFRALMWERPDYVDHGHNGQVKYFCTIQTGGLIHLIGLLRPSGEHVVPEGVPQVKYANERYHVPAHNYYFTGQLYPATYQNVIMLLGRLRE